MTADFSFTEFLFTIKFDSTINRKITETVLLNDLQLYTCTWLPSGDSYSVSHCSLYFHLLLLEVVVQLGAY